MAEAMFRSMLQKSKKNIQKDIKILSAGTAALDGLEASKNAILAMKEKEIDLCSHKAKLLTKGRIKEADLILTMTETHKLQVLKIDPKASNKTYTLKEYATGSKDNIDISDPFGQSLKIYRKCADEIEEALKMLLEKL